MIVLIDEFQNEFELDTFWVPSQLFHQEIGGSFERNEDSDKTFFYSDYLPSPHGITLTIKRSFSSPSELKTFANIINSECYKATVFKYYNLSFDVLQAYFTWEYGETMSQIQGTLTIVPSSVLGGSLETAGAGSFTYGKYTVASTGTSAIPISGYSAAANTLGAILIANQNRDATNWYDDTSNNFDGTLVNSPTWSDTGGPAPSIPGYFSFNGTTQRSNHGNNSLFAFQRAHTIVWWMRETGAQPESYPMVVSKGEANGFVIHGSLVTDRYDYYVRNSSPLLNDGVNTILAEPSVWHMYVARHSGTRVSLYRVTGAGAVELAGYNSSTDLGTDSSTFSIGAQDESGTIVRWWKGDVAGVLAFNKSITTIEMEDLYEASQQTQSFDISVVSGLDDAYEVISTGVTVTSVADNNIGKENITDEPVLTGFRFTNIALATGAAVYTSNLKFVARSSNTPEFITRIRAHAHDNSPTFSTTGYDISNRTLTTAYVDWSIPVWVSGQNDEDTLSPDVSGIVTEVTGRAGWASGNAISFVFSTAPSDPSLSRRRPESFESNSTLAARLLVNTTGTPAPTPTPTPTTLFDDGYDDFGFEGIDSETTSTHLKDGTSMGSGTGSMKYYFDAYMTAFLRSNAMSTANVDSRFGHRDVFHVGREGGRLNEYGLNVFRLTGHLPILDRLIYAWNRVKANFVVPYDTTSGVKEWTCSAWSLYGYFNCCGVGGSGSGNPWSPFPKLLYYYDEPRYYGTDTERENPHKFRMTMAQFAWALHMNRGKVSPAGYNYATEADYWAERIEEYVDTWSMGPWPVEDCWRFNYRGCDSAFGFHPTRDSSAPRRRAEHGVWPISVRNGAHSPLSQILGHRYIGLLGLHGQKAGGAPLAKIINASAAQAGGHAIAEKMIPEHYEAAVDGAIDSYGRDIYLPTGSQLGGSRDDEPERMTYTAHNNSHYLGMWLSGAYRGSQHYSRQRLLRYARAMADAIKPDGSTYSVIGGPIDYGGHGLDTRADSGGRSVWDNAASAYSAALIWADETESGGMRLWDSATTAQNAEGGGYGSNCRGPHLPAAQFIKRALDAVGDLGSE